MNVNYSIPALIGTGQWRLTINGGVVQIDDLLSAWQQVQLITTTPRPPQQCAIGADFPDLTPGTFSIPTRIETGWWDPQPDGTIAQRGAQNAAWNLWGAGHYEKKLTAGIYKSSDGIPWMLVMPWWNNMSPTARVVPFPPLLGLRGRTLSWPDEAHDASWHAETVWFFHRLDDSSTRWHAMVREAGRLLMFEQTQADSSMLLALVNQASRQARGTLYGGRPFTGALPFLELVPGGDASTQPFSNVALLSLGALQDSPPLREIKLTRLLLGKDGIGRKLRAHLDWAAPWRDQAAGGEPPELVVDGIVDASDQSAFPGQFIDWPLMTTAYVTPSQQAVDIWVQASKLSPPTSGQDPTTAEPLLCFALRLSAVRASMPWIRMGSIEIQPLPDPGNAARLLIKVFGRWTQNEADLYPVCTLENLPCQFRYAAGNDQSEDDARASGDLARESSPIVDTDHQSPRQGTLTMLSQFGPGADAIISVEIREDGAAPHTDDPSALWLNLAPFMVAQVGLNTSEPGFPDGDKPTLSWRSDDPQGAQWRVSNRYVRVTLPPQAVAEEMDRGNRFWTISSSGLVQQGLPLHYRFSPPTSLTLQPSPPNEGRRFEPSPLNLLELARGSYIVSMTTEMAYPLQVSYQQSPDSKRSLLLSETSTFYGAPAPMPPGTHKGRLPPGLRDAPFANATTFDNAVDALLKRQAVSRANFVTRLAELWVYDPLRDRHDLQLDDINVTIRGVAQGAPALLNPLPVIDDLLPDQKGLIAAFLDHGADWSSGPESIRGGVLYSFEIGSELVAVLKEPDKSQAVVESLALSALGATGGMNAAFDQGKTTFTIRVEHGQLSRLVKARIGRIGALWNRARHVVVYERSTAPSQQFQLEQTDTALEGWPILRKWEEYVELLEPDRSFAGERDAQENRAGFVEASVFVSRRIYVNSAWARDLGSGYELPLWDIHAASVDPQFYPKPQIHLRCFGEANRPTTRLWFEDPQYLYFYSSTLDFTTADTDAWAALKGVDFDNLPRLPVLKPTNNATPPAQGNRPRLTQGPPADPNLCTSQRFDLRVNGDGPVNLQHGRGSTPMLTYLKRVSIARSSQPSAVSLEKLSAHPAVGPVLALANAARAAAPAAAQAAPNFEQFAHDLLAQIGTATDCSSIATSLKQEVDGQVAQLNKYLVGDVADIKQKLSRTADLWQASFRAVVDDLISRATLSPDIATAQATALRNSVEAASRLMDVTPAWAARRQSLASEVENWRTSIWTRANAQLSDGMKAIATLAQTARDALTSGNAALTAHNLDHAIAQVVSAQVALQGCSGTLRPVVDPLASSCDVLLKQLHALNDAHAVLQVLASDMTGRLCDLATSWCTAAAGAFDALFQWASALIGPNGFISAFQAMLADAQSAVYAACSALTAAPRTSELQQALHDLDAALDPANKQGMLSIYIERSAFLSKNTNTISAIGAQTMKGAADHLIDQANQALAGQPAAIGAALKALIDASAASCEDLKQKLGAALSGVSTWATGQATATLAAVLSNEASARFASLASEVAEAWDSGAQGLQLTGCVGALPAISPLEFGIDCAAYSFDAAVRKIDMTPVLAYLRRASDGLEALATVTPHCALLDQLELDSVSNLKFSDVFDKFAGMNLDGLFPKFVLPDLNSDHIKITHGFDEKQRRAWVNAQVAFSHPNRENVFDIGPIALGVENTDFRAFSGVEVDTHGPSVTPPSTRTHATLLSDWLLDAGGQTLVRFKRVSLVYDGVKGFDFNVDPHDIELHPGLKFLTDFIARFSDAVPSWIDIDVADGRSVGITASTSTVFELGDLGAVCIGPIDIRSRFGLTFKNGKFAILSACDVGSREHPIFVQVSFLGGGVWMEARALYVDGKITPHVTIGASLGSLRSINLGGVAQANYSIQLFCYIEVGNDTSIAVGLSMVGAARILGFVTANVSLLLEAHHEGGVTEGTGRLDVSVQISWCFTFRYKQAVRHRF